MPEQSRGRDLPRTLTASEAAALLGVSVATVRGWADQKQLPSHRTVGGHRRFEVEELKHWLAARGAPVPERVRRFVRTGGTTDIQPCPQLARELNSRTDAVVQRVVDGYADEVPTWGSRASAPALRRSTVRFLRVATAALETGNVDRSVDRAEIAGFRGAMQGDQGVAVTLELMRLAIALGAEAEDAIGGGAVTEPLAMQSLLAVLDHMQAAVMTGYQEAIRARYGIDEFDMPGTHLSGYQE
ncbi:MAG: helix-turn-helix domain-containing protein [Thermoleophilia bacterium]